MSGDCEHCDHGHEGGEGGHEHGSFLPPPQEQRIIPEFPMLWRGLGLLGLSAGGLLGALWAARHSTLLALPAVPVMGLAAALSGWAAVIHLTGGEQFDDHPFV